MGKLSLFSPDGNILSIGNEHNSLHLWDDKTGFSIDRRFNDILA